VPAVDGRRNVHSSKSGAGGFDGDLTEDTDQRILTNDRIVSDEGWVAVGSNRQDVVAACSGTRNGLRIQLAYCEE
jgi:hypothetical protein